MSGLSPPLTISAAFRELYTSADFVTSIEDDWMPSLLEVLEPGKSLLDLEAGPGFALPRLRSRFERVTATSIDQMRLPFSDDHFDAATAILSLHHLPSPADQDHALRELIRVVRPGGLVGGLNPIDGPHFRRLDADGTCTPIDPMTFADRLRLAGLTEVDMTVWSFVRFVGRVPGGEVA